MSDRLNVRIAVDITTADGQPYNNNVVEYHSMSRQSVLMLERLLIDGLMQLNDFGQQQEAAKAAPPAHSQAGGKKR